MTIEYEFPEKTPKFVRDFLKDTFASVHSILGGNLVGIYLYGSLAMECFNPKVSDIDIILVVKKGLSKEQRRKVIEYLKGIGSKDRRIELSIVREGVVQNPRYPIIVDLHFEY